jgi:catechol 2,3-dioxygenase-like lactoylglutathione lyase family enzyme
MAARVPVSRVIHTIHAVADIHAARALYQDALGGLVFAENYFPAEDRDAALLYVTDHMVEPMAPRRLDDLTKPFARQFARIGQAFHSFEIKVADGKAASAAFREAGCTVAADYGVFFFVKPESTGGVLLEVCELPMPNDPWERGNWNPQVGAGHHCTVTGLDHIACATADIETALRFFTEVVDGEVLEDAGPNYPNPRAGSCCRWATRGSPSCSRTILPVARSVRSCKVRRTASMRSSGRSPMRAGRGRISRTS